MPLMRRPERIGPPVHKSSTQNARNEAGFPPGPWMGRGLPALGLTAASVVTERQAAFLFVQGRHPDADRIERELLDDGAAPETARSATVLGRPIEEIEKRKQIPLVALDQTSLIVLRAPGEEKTRRVIERAHERAIATELRWPEDEATESWWASGLQAREDNALVVAPFRRSPRPPPAP